MFLAIFRVFVFVCIIFAASPVVAAQIDEAGAARLKAVFENVIKQQTQYAPSEGPRPKFEGAVIVEPTDSYYAVTLPYYWMHMDDGMRMDFGMVSINATPDTVHDGRWKMAIATPTPITIVDEGEKAVFRIDIGAQRAAGIWDEDIQNFIKLDALYSDITARSTGNDDFKMIIPQALIRYDMVEDADKKLSGDGFVVIKNMAIDALDAGAKGGIDSVRLDFKMDQYDARQALAQQKRLQALIGSSGTEGLDTTAHGQELASTLMKLYSSFGEHMQVGYTIKGVDFQQSDDGEDNRFQLDDLTLGFDMGGFVSDNVYLGLAFGFLGMDAETAKADVSLAPSDMNFDLKLKNIPIKQVSGLAQNAVMASMNNSNGGAMAMMSLAMKLPVILSQAGTVIEMKDNFIGNDSYRFDINGVVKADMEAMNSATADIQGRFKGLDGLLQKVRAQAVADAENAAQYRQALERLQMLQKIGAKQGEEDLYLYNFQMNAQGQMLLNGQNAKAVMGGG